LYSLEINAERVIPACIDSKLNIDKKSLPKAEGRPQRKAARKGRLKTKESYKGGEV